MELKRTKPSGTHILLVDDHPIVRERLAEILNREGDLKVCAEAEDRPSAIRAAETTSLDLAIVDLALRNSSGLELIKDLHTRWPRLLILVVSMHDELLYAERVLRAGARGYITKQEATRKILLAVRCVLSGQIYLNDKAASTVLSRLASRTQTGSRAVEELLSDRELQVFELIGKGLNTRDIARRLYIDVKTVETYRARIKLKLNLQSPSELLQVAIRWGQLR